MADKKLVALHPQLPAAPLSPSETALPKGPFSVFWNGEIGALQKNTEFFLAREQLLTAQKKEADALSSLIDARVAVAVKLGTLQSTLMAIEAEKQQQRLQAHHANELKRARSTYELEILAINHEEAVFRARQAAVIAQRDFHAASLTKDKVVKQIDLEQDVRVFNAQATAQDAAADLARTTPGAATGAATDALNILEHEIEIQTKRDPNAARALQNLRSRIKGSKS